MSALSGSLCFQFLTLCLPAWVVLFALLKPLSFGFSTFVFQLGLSSSPFSDLSPSISLHSSLGSDVRLFRNSVLAMCLPAWVFTSALCPAAPSQFVLIFLALLMSALFRFLSSSLHNLAAWVVKCSPFSGLCPFHSLHLS